MVLGIGCYVNFFSWFILVNYSPDPQTSAACLMPDLLPWLFTLHLGISLRIPQLAHRTRILSCSSLRHLDVCDCPGSRAQCKRLPDPPILNL
jgi:hypothetical protein